MFKFYYIEINIDIITAGLYSSLAVPTGVLQHATEQFSESDTGRREYVTAIKTWYFVLEKNKYYPRN